VAQKGSKYARKHLVEEKPGQKNKDILPLDHEAFLNVIYEDYDYLKVFNALNADQQLKAWKTLKKLSESNDRKMRYLAAQSAQKLEAVNAQAGLVKKEMLSYPLSADEHHLIRMDCYGCVDRRPVHQLSDLYRQMIKTPMTEKLPLNYYKLDNAPSWQLFRQFQNFRLIEDELIMYLSNHRIDPEILKIMGVRDFSDLIFKTFQKNNDDIKVKFVEGDSYRNEFVKDMALIHGDQIAKIMLNNGIDERYVYSLLNAMKCYGNCEAGKIVITERYFTERTLRDLKKAGVVGDFVQGEEIPQHLIDYLIAQDQGYLLAARKEDGSLLNSADFPSFEVHHKVAVSESGRMPNLAVVNYPNNFLLVSRNLHTFVLHASDKLSIAKGKESYRCRMEFQDPKIAFMFSLNPQDQISYNWSNEFKYQKRALDDSRSLVSYDSVQAALSENIKKFRGIKVSENNDFEVNDAFIRKLMQRKIRRKR